MTASIGSIFNAVGQKPTRAWLTDIAEELLLSMIGTPPSFADTPEPSLYS
jgi:hypothetical protein